jgi:hypothetical protein
MTTHQKIAAGLALFALFGLAISPLGAAPNPMIGDDRRTVSIAISSGSQLRLIHQASSRAIRKEEDRRTISCRRVFYLKVADIGLSCQSNGAMPRQKPQIASLKVD